MHLINPGLLIVFILLFINSSAASQEYIYRNFSVDDGLPSSEVFDIYQDKSGYLWFATDKGLSRYNGYEFTNYNTNDGLPGNTVLKFYPQENGQVWCYALHRQSLFYFNEEFDGFRPFEYNDLLHESIEKESIVKSVFVDESGNVHIGGFEINGGIIISPDGDVTRLFASSNFYKDSINRKKIILKPVADSATATSYFIALNDEELGLGEFLFQKEQQIGARLIANWHITNNLALIADWNSVTLLSKDQENVTINTGYPPIGINSIDEEHFFVGYEYGGGEVMDLQGNVAQTFLEDHSVTSMLVDHEGGYWFSTLNSGVFYLKDASISIYNDDESSCKEVKSLIKIGGGELLVGYENGMITHMSENRSQIITYKPSSTTHALVEYDDQLGKRYTYSDGQVKGNQKRIVYEGYLLKISEPEEHTVIFSGLEGFYLSSKTGGRFYSTRYRVLDVCLWGNDTIVATPMGIYSYANNELHELGDNSPMFRYRSDDIDISDNTIYAATQGAGLVIMSDQGVKNLDVADGLSSNIVNEIYIENDSIVWTCTISGLDRIIWEANGVNISSITKEDGLLSNEVKDIEIINDTIWVGTKQGLCFFPKSELSPGKIAVPDVIIKDVLINNIPQSDKAKPFIQYKIDQIDLLLEGISYAHNEDVFYKYRLNQNENWSITQNRRIQFSSLAWGDYLFEGQMCIDDQNCTENVVRYKFTIQPPIWARWWFVSLLLLALTGLVYSFFKIRVLTYNKDVTRELIRLMIKKLSRDEMYFSFRENGKDIRIRTRDIIYIKSAGNYIDLYTAVKTHTIRLNIGKFLDRIPDHLEYVQLHRSYIVRIDKIISKSTNEVALNNGVRIPVSQNHQDKLKSVVF